MAKDYNVLVENGTFAPSAVLTSEVAKYQNFKYGWLIHWSNYTFSGYINYAPVANFNIQNANIKEWANRAKRNGVQYAGLTVVDPQGWMLYPSDVNLPAQTSAAHAPNGVIPVIPNRYCVQAPADLQIVEKFVTEMRAVNIEPVFYVNPYINVNLTGAKLLIDPALTEAQQESAKHYVCLIVQEMVLKFGVKYMWFDMSAAPQTDLSQRIYNAIKSVDPTCTMISNVLGEYDMERGPYDVESTEEHVIYSSGNTAYQSNVRTWNGNTVYIGQEVCATPFGSESEWYYTHPGLPGASDYHRIFTSSSVFQNLIDNAHAFNRPTFIDMQPDIESKLRVDMINYLRYINFDRPKINIIANEPLAVVARENMSFADAGVTGSNIEKIIKVSGNPLKTFIPGRSTNDITAFEKDCGYLIFAKQDMSIVNIYTPPY